MFDLKLFQQHSAAVLWVTPIRQEHSCNICHKAVEAGSSPRKVIEEIVESLLGLPP